MKCVAMVGGMVDGSVVVVEKRGASANSFLGADEGTGMDWTGVRTVWQEANGDTE